MVFPNGTQVRLLRPEEIAGLAELPPCYSNTTGLHTRRLDGWIYENATRTAVIQTYNADTGRYLVRFTNAWELWLLPQEFTVIIPLVEGGAE